MATSAVAMELLEFISMAALAVAMVLPGIVAVVAGVHLYGSPCCSYGAAGILAVAAGVHLYGSPCCSMVLPDIVVMAAGVHLYGSPCCSYGAA